MTPLPFVTTQALLDWLHPEAATLLDPERAFEVDGGDDGKIDALLPCNGFDTIIAADVIYDEWHAEAVPKMCLRYLKQQQQQQQHGAASNDDSAVRCLIVLGDRKARRGIPLFEANMLQAGFSLQHSECTTKMSEYAYSWSPPPL